MTNIYNPNIKKCYLKSSIVWAIVFLKSRTSIISTIFFSRNNTARSTLLLTSSANQTYIQVLFTILIFISPGNSYADPPVLAVASNLIAPMKEIATAFKVETGKSVKLSFGSSGSLSQQILHGAPYELFISASEDHVDFLQSHGASIQSYSKYIYGEIGFYVPNDSSFYNTKSLKSIINILAFNFYGKIVIANPNHAPYGVASMQALQNAGIFSIEKNRIIHAENVSQIVPYTLSGNVDMAIIPYSFITESDLLEGGKYFSIPEIWYDKIIQCLVTFDDASKTSLHFKDFLMSLSARNIMKKFGYNFVQG